MAPVSSSDIFTEKFASRAYRRSSGDVFPVARSIRTLAIVVFIVVYGLVCYQIGAEFRSIEQFVQIVDAPVPPCDHYNAGFAHVRKRELDESQMPYKCGVVFFYHVPSTGGVSDSTCIVLENCFPHALLDQPSRAQSTNGY